MSDINNDIQKQIKNKNLVLRDIPDYTVMLNKMDLLEDCPEEGVYIEGMPNINGMIILLMLTCCISGESGISKEITLSILDMFQKPTISEVYNNYVEIFTPFMKTLSGEQDEIKGLINEMGNKLTLAAQKIDTVIQIQDNKILVDEFMKMFLKKYDINNPGYSTSCCVTLADFVDGESIFTLPCGHSISLKGLSNSISSNSQFNQCPICRDDPLKNAKFWEGIGNINNVLSEYKMSEEVRLLNKCKEDATKVASKYLGN